MELWSSLIHDLLIVGGTIAGVLLAQRYQRQNDDRTRGGLLQQAKHQRVSGACEAVLYTLRTWIQWANQLVEDLENPDHLLREGTLEKIVGRVNDVVVEVNRAAVRLSVETDANHLVTGFEDLIVKATDWQNASIPLVEAQYAGKPAEQAALDGLKTELASLKEEIGRLGSDAREYLAGLEG